MVYLKKKYWERVYAKHGGKKRAIASPGDLKRLTTSEIPFKANCDFKEMKEKVVKIKPQPELLKSRRKKPVT